MTRSGHRPRVRLLATASQGTQVPGFVRVLAMSPPPTSVPPSPAPVPAPTVNSGAAALAPIGFGRLLAVAVPHLAALSLMLETENEPGARFCFVLSWAFLNFFWLALLRRPALSGAVSLTFVAILVALSRLKHDIVQMTANFVDLMMLDRDSIAFFFTIYPNLRWTTVLSVLLILPLMVMVWRLDPFRVRRLPAAAAALACLSMLTAFSLVWPQEDWRGYYADNYVSKFTRSGVVAISDFVNYGFFESDPAAAERLKLPLEDSCHPAARRPHIIMIHDESSYDIRSAPQIKVPPGYGSHFVSGDGKARKFLAESNGGSSWLTEYNVLTGLSSRSFGRFSYFVTRIAAHRVERGLPLALRRCGYSTVSLYPAYGAFMGEQSFQATTGMQKFYDAGDLGAKGLEPDGFFYDSAVKLLAQEKPGTPVFMYVYLAANHFPWAAPLRPDLTPGWKNPGNDPAIDEYLRRQSMSVLDYAAFIAKLKKQFPGEPFLIVRYGDHQPEFSSNIIEPNLTEDDVAKRLMTYDQRYYATYYAIDAVNFKPVASATAMETIDAAYLPLVVQDAAGLPLDPTFEEQKKIMLRCNGMFYSCNGGSEARRFNRMLIDAGFIKNL